jgi:protein-L-isoaspartate(D-aspartate) O-methyltransferase
MKATATNYTDARKAMVDSQIHPMGVVDETLLEAFLDVPRELFFPEDKRGASYCDEDVEIINGRYLMEPSVFARLVQFADLKADDVILTIGAGLGYNASILSKVASTVIALEEEEELIKKAQVIWDELGYCNIAAALGPLIEGAPVNAPYDTIIFNGAVSSIPQEIKEQLNDGGRLVAVVRATASDVGKATLVERRGDHFSQRVLFDAGTPFLKGFEPKSDFVF